MAANNQITEVALEKALKLLNAIGAKYHIEFNGSEYGQSLMLQKKYRRGANVSVGVTAHVRSYLLNLNVGEVAKIPTKNYSSEAVQSVIGAIAGRLYGRGSFITSQSKDSTTVEILRIK